MALCGARSSLGLRDVDMELLEATYLKTTPQPRLALGGGAVPPIVSDHVPVNLPWWHVLHS